MGEVWLQKVFDLEIMVEQITDGWYMSLNSTAFLNEWLQPKLWPGDGDQSSKQNGRRSSTEQKYRFLEGQQPFFYSYIKKVLRKVIEES